ncbi:uncharacterized protein LOC130445138 [Diorhabda sublineata]|uniref:uncharacterized protein LOC130445138 n=1 Tax=Diorhabda sublineata TaxID=1163346 RepID=UPI0024E0625E|nr:uncharacterized protein LOC130445138 [Diorhabda sublineata]
MRNVIFLTIFLMVRIDRSIEITTIHHDKPETATIHIASSMESNTTGQDLNKIPLSQSERHKRLLPYINFYKSQPNNRIVYEKPPKGSYTLHREQRPNNNAKFNPFTESNLAPGPFKPILPRIINVQYVPTNQNKIPNFGEIYDKLSQLKLSQNRRPSYFQIKRPISQQNFLSKPQIYNKQKLIQPSKTTVETYTPRNVDIPSEQDYQLSNLYSDNKPYVNQQIAVEIPRSSIDIQENYNGYLYQDRKKPFIIVSANNRDETSKEIYVRPINNQYQSPPQYRTDLNPNYEPFPEHKHTPMQPDYPNAKNPINLSAILKYLQAVNALPKTLTSHNIDNSIKTLVNILNSLKKQQKLTKPEYTDEIENEADLYHPNYISDLYPEDTEEGGTPGKPGVDYPALSTIPRTSFNCKTQRYKGFFGDPDTNCQVWHYCDLNGGQASFLCPNGTIFSQVALTCDWWYNVKCASTPQLYVLNERLYKYIIPLSPKFPEDYTGPLVDKYLALKFQEMEDKMKKEKKGKEDKTEPEKGEHQESEKEDVGKVVKLNAPLHKETLETVENDNGKE